MDSVGSSRASGQFNYRTVAGVLIIEIYQLSRLCGLHRREVTPSEHRSGVRGEKKAAQSQKIA